MIAKADVELREVEAQAEERAGRECLAFICDAARIHDDVVAPLVIAARACAPGRVDAFAVAIRRERLGVARGRRAFDLETRDRIWIHVALHVAPHLLAGDTVAFARARQRIEDDCRRDRTPHDGLSRKREHPFDLALDIGGETQGKIRRGAARAGARRHDDCGDDREAKTSGQLQFDLQRRMRSAPLELD